MTDTLPEPLRLAEDAERWAFNFDMADKPASAASVRSYATCLRSTHAEAEKLRARVAELEAKLADAGKDAARYRWLRDVSVPPHNFYISVPDEFHDARYTPAEVDSYIDAAIAAKEQPHASN